MEKENRPRIGVVILSRFSSKRLPGKALIRIHNKPVLQYIIERLNLIFNKDLIIIATSISPSDQPIVDFARRNKVSCFRGSLHNVAERFYFAAKQMRFDYAIRINGDNIFTDWKVLKQMVKIAKTNKFSFVSNLKERTFPRGMSIEIIKLRYYKSLLRKIYSSRKHREHVTSYLYEAKSKGRHYYYKNTMFPSAYGIQLALDTPADLDMIKKIVSFFKKRQERYTLKEILGIYRRLL